MRADYYGTVCVLSTIPHVSPCHKEKMKPTKINWTIRPQEDDSFEIERRTTNSSTAKQHRIQSLIPVSADRAPSIMTIKFPTLLGMLPHTTLLSVCIADRRGKNQSAMTERQTTYDRLQVFQHFKNNQTHRHADRSICCRHLSPPVSSFASLFIFLLFFSLKRRHRVDEGVEM